jgi:hypothetical protein
MRSRRAMHEREHARGETAASSQMVRSPGVGATSTPEGFEAMIL